LEPFVARALALLHHDITRRWTVDDLGREVGLSRSALADRFIRLISRSREGLRSRHRATLMMRAAMICLAELSSPNFSTSHSWSSAVDMALISCGSKRLSRKPSPSALARLSREGSGGQK
jgi:hypothetical protein